MYLDELEDIPVCTPEEEAMLLQQISHGDEQAKQRLVEGNLKALAELAKTFESQELSINDLIQEANLAFLALLDGYKGTDGEFQVLVHEHVSQALQAAVSFQKQEKQVEEEVTARVNVLKEVSQIMADELGREATVEELAAKMKMTVDEVKDIMKLTLDALSVSPE